MNRIRGATAARAKSVFAPGVHVRCSDCDYAAPAGFEWLGCPQCGWPLEVGYDDEASERLPIEREALTDLGRMVTPLMQLAEGLESTWLKLESRNPTGSHKDRFHTVASAIARRAGAPGVVTTSTGNHGVACAAHAAADSLGCVVLASAPLPPALARQIAAYGGKTIVVDSAGRHKQLTRLLADGWHPSTSSDPALSGAANPYGLEGYKDIAAEIVAQLGRMPELVTVPAASGDLFVGVARGFAEAAGVGPAPLIVACQPTDAAALPASLDAGQQVTLESTVSIARSTSDPRSGRLAIHALKRPGCSVVTVSEEEIAERTRRLAAVGHYVEDVVGRRPRGHRRCQAARPARRDATAVAVLTAQGRG